MSQYIPISKNHHAGFGYSVEKPFVFAKEWSFIPLTSKEISQFISTYPVVFQKKGDGFQLGIATGLGGLNCLVHPKNFKFLLPYVPAILRRYPFNLLSDEAGKQILCVLDCEQGFARGNGEAILNEGAELTEKGQGLVSFLEQLNASFINDSSVVAFLTEIDIFTELPVQVKDSETGGLKTLRSDLYRVDEVKLNALTEMNLKELMEIGAFPMIYGHLFSLQSLSQLNVLVESYNQLTAHMQETADNLEKMFSDDESDVLKF